MFRQAKKKMCCAGLKFVSLKLKSEQQDICFFCFVFTNPIKMWFEVWLKISNLAQAWMVRQDFKWVWIFTQTHYELHNKGIYNRKNIHPHVNPKLDAFELKICKNCHICEWYLLDWPCHTHTNTHKNILCLLLTNVTLFYN